MSARSPAQRRDGLRRTWLIARREFVERVAQRAFLIALVIGALIAAAAVVVPTLIDDDSGPSASTGVAVTIQDGSGQDVAVRLAALTEAARQVPGEPLTFKPAASADAVRQAVADGDESLGIIVTGSEADPELRVLTREGGGGPIEDQVQEVVTRAALKARLAAAGLTADRDLAPVLQPIQVSGEMVRGAGPTTVSAIVVSVLGLLLYIGGITLMNGYATGIVTDRTNRVTERLLTAAKPHEHLAGKLIGVGAAGLLQFFIWIVVAIVADLITSGAGGDSILARTPSTLIVYFPAALVLTYVIYAALATVLVLPVRKSEDVTGAVAPATMLQVFAFIIATTIVTPGATVSKAIEWLSLIPFFSPLLMLARLAGGGVPAWQVAVAVLGPLVLAAILLRLAAPAYARYAIDAPGGKGMKAAFGLLRRAR
jgi:ABC-2 type transport system permease protein